MRFCRGVMGHLYHPYDQSPQLSNIDHVRPNLATCKVWCHYIPGSALASGLWSGQILFNASTRLDNQSSAGSKLIQALLKIGILS